MDPSELNNLLKPRTRAPPEALDALGRVEVQSKCHWMSLSHINSVQQTFVALLWVQLNWYASPSVLSIAQCNHHLLYPFTLRP